jgi:hypothetical protein
MAPVQLGSFTLDPRMPATDDKIQSMRGGNDVVAPEGSFTQYLKATLTEELRVAGLFDPKSNIVITASMLEARLNTNMGTASGQLRTRFTVTRDHALRYDRELTAADSWEGSFVAASAIPAAANHYQGLFRRMVGILLDDMDFKNAVGKEGGPAGLGVPAPKSSGVMAGRPVSLAPGVISPAGMRLGARFDGMDIEHRWLPGQRIDPRTGEASGRPFNSPKSRHGAEFVAAFCARSGIFISPGPVVNDQVKWLVEEGQANGWTAVTSPFQAQRLANAGQIVVAGYPNPSASRGGIVALVRPSIKSDEEIQLEGPQVIHAGSENSASSSVNSTFMHFKGAWQSASDFQVRFFAHANQD